jgi:ABC-type sugar transport system ATPase subunit
MSITVSFKKRLRYFDLDISFSFAKKNMMVMIGPSGGGSGKTGGREDYFWR